ncbi:Carbohydrate esterase family 16 protein [Mycena venus]|uniref:Carbohydrate esterase family 16 protein n=1 Tax=Mycena venus TaxID=2733690 RepID=A0A8H6YN46_9AGAR|nr:Carbohydrate esterase family 16 protein [Mycena venus]
MAFLRSLPIIALVAAGVGAQSPVWGQCGGQGWTGPTSCVTGATCTFSNAFYSQCLPSSATGTTTTTATTTITGTSIPPIPTGQVTYWFPFGDSYTTTGFDPNSTLPTVGNPLGNPPFPGFTGGGGENFVGYDTVTFNKSTIMTYNYAYGGATIDANLVVPYLPTVLSLTDQVNEFLAGAAKKPATTPWTSANALFTVWIGINDIGNSYGNGGDRDAFVHILRHTTECIFRTGTEALVRDFVYNISLKLTQRSGAGARNFLFINVPPIDRSPLMLAEPAASQALEKTVIAGFNTKLAAQISSFKANNSGVTTWLWDSNAAFTTILNAPTQFGFVDAVSFGNTGDFWGNNYHPSSAAHQIFAKQISTLLAGTPWF